MDLIGKCIYDYCHAEDQKELRQILAHRPDGELARSFILRFKSQPKEQLIVTQITKYGLH